MHPGEILLEEFMLPLALSRNALARALHVPPNHVSDVVNGKRGISAVMNEYGYRPVTKLLDDADAAN